MPRTPMAALRAALPMTIAALALTLFAGHALTSATPASASTPNACADRMCTKDRPGVRACRSYRGYRTIARCFIDRAAKHFRQSQRSARAIAYRESRYHWWVTNYSRHRGLYQFSDTLWRHTPYRGRSVYNPRYAALAAMWLWRHGGKHHWACC